MTLLDTLMDANQEDWQRYVTHPFVRQIGEGTLDAACFEHYLKQDYVFLIHFARSFGLAVFKSNTIEEIQQAKSLLTGIVDVELDLHVEYCERWGLSKEQLAATVESTSNMAYTRYVMERGLSGDLLDLNVALAPCIIGYAEVAKWLIAQPSTVRQNNPYDEWITMYASEEYQQVAATHTAALNKTDPKTLSPQRLQELKNTVGSATRLEVDFWQMGIDIS